MQMIDNSYLDGVAYHKSTKPMHNLKANFDKILPIVNNTLQEQLNAEENLQFYPRKPDLSDTRGISLVLLAEALGIDSERWLWSKLQADYWVEFPYLPHICNYNRRRK